MNRKEKVLNFIKDNRETPFSYNEIKVMLGIYEENTEEFDNILSELLNDKSIILTKKKRYKYNKENDYFTGEFIGNNKGYGFIKSDEFSDDFFVSPENRKNALNKDLVKFKIISEKKKDKRREAVVVEVCERNNITLVGTYKNNKNFGFVICDDKKFDKDVFIPKGKTKNAKDGEKVVVMIKDYGGRGKNPEGVITEVIGYFEQDGNDVISVIKEYNLPSAFPKDVILEGEYIAKEEIVAGNRCDLRDKLVITIDGEDAKDLDDAISLKKVQDNYILGVHISDVSHYIKENTIIDKEAYKRGTSVYLADRVIPMFPKCISNGICSLHPGVDRLTLSVFVTIDKSGKVINYDFVRSIISSKYRMSYKEVTDILLNGKSCDRKLKKMLSDMKDLALILRGNRKKRGSLDFDFPECKITFDKSGKPVNIEKYEMTLSNYIIEEFMLLANETVAEHIFWQNKPMIYRIHEEPDYDKIDKFKVFVKNLGYNLKGSTNGLHPKSLLKLLEEIKGDKSERIIQTIMLRSLMKARYSLENKGHFGLASKYYCHFTSPIRRYPDLITHRLLKLIIDNKFDDDKVEKYTSYIDKASLHTSEREITAQNAERETEDIKKAIYMKDKIGEEFEGIISSVTGFGFFVELDNTIEGLVRYKDLKDYYEFDEKMYVARGERTGKTYKIGDKIKVRVVASSPQLKEIDFEPV